MQPLMKRLSYFILCCFLPFAVLARNNIINNTGTFIKQKDSTEIFSRRICILKITGSAFYLGMLTDLTSFSYRNNLQAQFHVYNNFTDWRLYMDKTHHAIATYYIGNIGYSLLRWAGENERQATWIGGLSGLFLLTTQEILDGFASKWSASSGDMAGNLAGSAVFISQQLVWHEQRVLLRWSYHPTSFPKYNPELLGNSFTQKMIKDYNGQTVWLSANMSSFLGRSPGILRWLNIALGYGATGIIGPVPSPPVIRDIPIPSFEKLSKFYVAPDIDLSHIKTRSALFKWIFEAVGCLKFPLPALEISEKGVKFHPLYF